MKVNKELVRKVTRCTPDVKSQINQVLGGSASTNSIEIPATNKDKPHVSCLTKDSVMGNVVKFTLYKNDNDPATQSSDRQRIEMKVFDKSPADLKAKSDTSYIYSWWFKLDSGL